MLIPSKPSWICHRYLEQLWKVISSGLEYIFEVSRRHFCEESVSTNFIQGLTRCSVAYGAVHELDRAIVYPELTTAVHKPIMDNGLL